MATTEEVTFVPLGEKSSITLSVDIIRKHFVKATRLGKMPTDGELYSFLQLCRSRELNPWVGDAFLTGYDTEQGTSAEFSLITSVQALLKRAEANPNFDGIESGVIVRQKATKDGRPGQADRLDGSFFTDDQELLGAWAKVYRKDRARVFSSSIRLGTFRKPTPIWSKNAEGMIQKCAKATSLREAFPTQLGGMYLPEEFERLAEGGEEKPKSVTDLQSLTAELEKSQASQCSSADTPVEAEATDTSEVKDIFTDYVNEISKCDNMEVLKTIYLSFKNNPDLDLDERRHLNELTKQQKQHIDPEGEAAASQAAERA